MFTRREALSLAGLSAVMLGVGALSPRAMADAAAEDIDKPLLRPPGYAEGSEDAFLSRCHRCQKCLSVCETNVLETCSAARSIRGAGTPVLNFDYSWCNFCGRCYEVCPTGALVPSSDDKPPIIGIARINAESCVAWSWSGCTVCSDVCPEEAIVLDEDMRPSVIEDACTGCGLCELRCPNASLRSFGDSSRTKGIVVYPLSTND